jgi:hypothetical protein
METNTAHIEAKGKEKFMALYLEQDVIVLPCFMSRDPNKICQTTVLTTGLLNVHKHNQSYLLLHTVKHVKNKEFEAICRGIGLQNAKVVERDNEVIMVVDGLYYIGFYTDGTVVMYIYENLHQKPVWNYIDLLYQALRGMKVLTKFTTIISGEVKTYEVEEILSNNWAKVKED